MFLGNPFGGSETWAGVGGGGWTGLLVEARAGVVLEPTFEISWSTSGTTCCVGIAGRFAAAF